MTDRAKLKHLNIYLSLVWGTIYKGRESGEKRCGRGGGTGEHRVRDKENGCA